VQKGGEAAQGGEGKDYVSLEGGITQEKRAKTDLRKKTKTTTPGGKGKWLRKRDRESVLLLCAPVSRKKYSDPAVIMGGRSRRKTWPNWQKIPQRGAFHS